MKTIKDHLKLKNPRLRCSAGNNEIEVCVSNTAGEPASSKELKKLKQIAGDEYKYLEPLYRKFNGVSFHESQTTAGLVVAEVNELKNIKAELNDWLEMMDPEDVYDFQRRGVPFATIESSGNYFVVYQGKVYYSDHDDLAEEAFSDSVEEFFIRALNDPAKFLNNAGCYTRYSDGISDLQYIPEEFISG